VRARLQFLTLDASPFSHREQARLALEGGVRWIQLRAKNLPESEWIKTAQGVAELCQDFGATFIVNDSFKVAHAAEADGVHLGSGDASPAEARAALGDYAIVGVTLNNLTHIAVLKSARVDYAGVGPVRFTQSKDRLAPVHSDESLRELIQQAGGIPTYAIGGVTVQDWPNLKALGAHGIAVSGAIALAADPEQAAREWVAAVSF
jgi:thiamine-phosphate pyrophosphorylase